VDSTAADSSERNGTGTDAEAQRAARKAIMKIRLFPDLTVALRGGLGYGPHVDMLQHFCYWMHPRHPK
jgi:nitrate reductase NapE component